MALTNIEYGSLASSSTMNNNFSYLDGRITSLSESTTTSISSILSNIATINASLSELSDDIDDAIDALDTKIEGYKTKLKLLISMANIAPNWEGLTAITLTSGTSYTAPSNGYLLITAGNAQTTVTINSLTYVVNSGVTVTLPVFKNDVAAISVTPAAAYLLPVKEVSIENF